MIVPPPYAVQRLCSDQAYELLNTFADRLTLEQRIRMTVVSLYAPERLGWGECGAAIALWAMVVEVRV